MEYYFSVENLCKDIFLRSKMDGKGWIPVAAILAFNRVRMMTSEPELLLESLAESVSVEVRGCTQLSPPSLTPSPAGLCLPTG